MIQLSPIEISVTALVIRMRQTPPVFSGVNSIFVLLENKDCANAKMLEGKHCPGG